MDLNLRLGFFLTVPQVSLILINPYLTIVNELLIQYLVNTVESRNTHHSNEHHSK